MTEHTLAVLTLIFYLLSFAGGIVLGITDADQTDRSIVSLIFGVPALIFSIWLCCTIVF